jgi:hypothetical protein
VEEIICQEVKELTEAKWGDPQRKKRKSKAKKAK